MIGNLTDLTDMNYERKRGSSLLDLPDLIELLIMTQH